MTITHIHTYTIYDMRLELYAIHLELTIGRSMSTTMCHTALTKIEHQMTIQLRCYSNQTHHCPSKQTSYIVQYVQYQSPLGLHYPLLKTLTSH